MNNKNIALFVGILSFFLSQITGDEIAHIAGLVGWYHILIWIYIDSAVRKDIYKPFDYGFLIYIFSIFYIPYYIVKTRGVRGVLFASVVVLFGILLNDFATANAF